MVRRLLQDPDSKDDPELPRILEAFGSRVRELRRSTGKTQTQVAAAAKMSHPYLVQIENAGANMTMSALLRLAKGLGVNPGALFPAMPGDPLGPAPGTADGPHAETVRALELARAAQLSLRSVQTELEKLREQLEDSRKKA